MTTPRSSPYMYATWPTRYITGDKSCLWACWFKTHHQRKGNYNAFRKLQNQPVLSHLFVAETGCEPCIIPCKAYRNVRLRAVICGLSRWSIIAPPLASACVAKLMSPTMFCLPEFKQYVCEATLARLLISGSSDASNPITHYKIVGCGK